MTSKATLIRFDTFDIEDRVNINGKPYIAAAVEVEIPGRGVYSAQPTWYRKVQDPRANGPVRTVSPAMTPATEPLDYDKLAAAVARLNAQMQGAPEYTESKRTPKAK